jgi:UDP-galactopyranose mutase
MPVNLDTLNAVFDARLETQAEAAAFLQAQSVPIAEPRNAAEHLRSRIGDLLTDLFFRPYTRKMWALELEDLDASVVKRLSIRFDHNDLYFPDDRHQALPRDGYTALFETLLRHPGITVELGAAYVPGLERDYAFCFNSMAIDECFDCALGELPYRSLRFDHRTATVWDAEPWSQRNYTDNGPLTRETWWHCLPNHVVRDTARRTVTVEEPCDYRDNGNERYYPVKTADQRYQKLYRAYRELADALPNMAFIGRCGTYQYLDMDQVINQSLAGVRRWLDART